jgi:hypothetical protein
MRFPGPAIVCNSTKRSLAVQGFLLTQGSTFGRIREAHRLPCQRPGSCRLALVYPQIPFKSYTLAFLLKGLWLRFRLVINLSVSQVRSIQSRRKFLTICGGAGIASTFFAGAVYALAAATPKKAVTPEMIDQAADLAGITILPNKRKHCCRSYATKEITLPRSANFI